MKKVIFVFAFWLAFLGNAYALPEETRSFLSELEQKMQKIETLQTRFLQKKQLSLFQREIQLEGSLAMQKPDHFAWRTESPVRYSIVTDGKKVSQWNEDTDQVEVLSFSSSPAARMVVEQMQTWFYGAYSALEEQYEITVISREPALLKFVPNEKSPASGMIRSVEIRFKPDLSYIDSIRIEEKNGDRSVMDFMDTVLNSKIDPEVWKAKHAA